MKYLNGLLLFICLFSFVNLSAQIDPADCIKDDDCGVCTYDEIFEGVRESYSEVSTCADCESVKDFAVAGTVKFFPAGDPFGEGCCYYEDDGLQVTQTSCMDCVDLAGTDFASLGFGDAGCETPLPVELLFFSTQQKDKRIRLFWATASEINNDYFSIEYSRDGEGFKEVGRIKGAGTTTEETVYDFFHNDPNVGDNYYRLRQVDMDGSFEYTDVVVVNVEGDQNFTIQPNLVSKQLVLKINKDLEEDRIGIIYDLLGREVQEVIIPANTQQTLVDVNDLAIGHYILAIGKKGGNELFRFVKTP